MRVLTVKQPWASLIASGIKRIENRSRKPPAAIATGERFAIHAGMGWDKNGEPFSGRADLPAGRIICTARVERVVTESDDPFFVGPFGWVLRDIQPAASASLRGQLGLWSVTDDAVTMGR